MSLVGAPASAYAVAQTITDLAAALLPFGATPAPAAVTAPGAASLSQPAPRIVLAPVPKMGKRAKDKEQASPAVRTSEPALALAATDAQ